MSAERDGDGDGERRDITDCGSRTEVATVCATLRPWRLYYDCISVQIILDVRLLLLLADDWRSTLYCLASISATAPLIALSARSRSLGGGGASSAGGGRPAASFFGAALAPATSTPSVAHRVESEPEKRRRRALPRFLAQSRTQRQTITRVQQPQQKMANDAATSRPLST